MIRLSELFGKDLYTENGDYKGKIYDIVVNLETGKLETITTEPLKVKTKQEAKKIIVEKSIPYKNVLAVKDIIIVGNKPSREKNEEKQEKASRVSTLVKYR
jgi:sporulation protein YlmC with PRC-barrel domain